MTITERTDRTHDARQRARAPRDRDHRCRPDRPRDGVPPRPGRPRVRRARRARPGRRPVAQRYDSLQLNTPAQYDSLPGMTFPRKRNLPDRAPDGRLPRGVRADSPSTSAAAPASPGSTGSTTALRVSAPGRHVPGRQRRGGHRRRAPPQGARRSPTGSTPASGSSTRATTATRPSCCPGRCSSSAPASPVPTSPSSSPGRATRPGCRASCRGDPGPHRSLQGRAGAPVLWFVRQPRAHMRTPVGRRRSRRSARRRTAGPRQARRPRRCRRAAHRGAHDGVGDGRPELDDGTVLDVAQRRLVHRLPPGVRVHPPARHPARTGGRGRARRGAGLTRAVLRGPAVPARLLLDADRRSRPGRRLHRGPDRRSDPGPLGCLRRRGGRPRWRAHGAVTLSGRDSR